MAQLKYPVSVAPSKLVVATAAMVWNGDLPRPLQQVLFDTADGITPSAAVRIGEHEPAVAGRSR